MGDLDYVYAVARIRVKEKGLLSNTDVAQMAGMKSEKDVLAYLADKGWGDATQEADAERMLAAEEEKTWALMRELKIDPEVFDVLSYPKLYHNLKAAIKDVCTSDSPPDVFYDIEGYGEAEMKNIIREQDYKALPEHMRKAAQDAYEIMLQTSDGQRCDIICDRACLTVMEEAGAKSGNKLLKDYEEETVAVTNIKIAARAARTGKSLAFLKEALAPCRKLNTDALAVAASKSVESLLEYLDTHGYRDASEALKESPSAFERWGDNRIIEAIRPQKTNSVSAGPIIAYYLARENEIKTARIILTAKANGFSEEHTRERVREMYG